MKGERCAVYLLENLSIYVYASRKLLLKIYYVYVPLLQPWDRCFPEVIRE